MRIVESAQAEPSDTIPRRRRPTGSPPRLDCRNLEHEDMAMMSNFVVIDRASFEPSWLVAEPGPPIW